MTCAFLLETAHFYISNDLLYFYISNDLLYFYISNDLLYFYISNDLLYFYISNDLLYFSAVSREDDQWEFVVIVIIIAEWFTSLTKSTVHRSVNLLPRAPAATPHPPHPTMIYSGRCNGIRKLFFEKTFYFNVFYFLLFGIFIYLLGYQSGGSAFESPQDIRRCALMFNLPNKVACSFVVASLH